MDFPLGIIAWSTCHIFEIDEGDTPISRTADTNLLFEFVRRPIVATPLFGESTVSTIYDG